MIHSEYEERPGYHVTWGWFDSEPFSEPFRLSHNRSRSAETLWDCLAGLALPNPRQHLGAAAIVCGGFPSWPQYSGVLSNHVSTDEKGENAKKLLFEFWSSPSKLFTLGGKVGCSSLASTIESSLLFTVSNWWPTDFLEFGWAFSCREAAKCSFAVKLAGLAAQLAA